MRTRLLLLLIAAAGQAACSPYGDDQSERDATGQSAGKEAGDAATVTVIEAPAGGCVTEWDGRTVSEEELTNRGIAVLEAGIERIGGIHRITETNLPYVRVEAAPETAWSCVRPALDTLARTGFMRVELRPLGERGPWQIAAFPTEGSPPNPFGGRAEIAADGAVSWNGEAVDAALLRQRADAAGTGPGDITVAAADDTPFSAVYEAVRTTGDDSELILSTPE